MSWENELTIIVRTLVNDLSEPYQFSDNRIQQVLTVAGKYVQFDVNLDRSYTIDVINLTITPDPIVENDAIFTSLTCLKASCIIDQSIYRTKAALEGIRAALGPAQLSIAGQSAAWNTMLDKGPCAAYEELTSHWDVKEATAIAAVLSPFAGNKFDPEFQNVRSTYGYRNSFYNP